MNSVYILWTNTNSVLLLFCTKYKKDTHAEEDTQMYADMYVYIYCQKVYDRPWKGSRYFLPCISSQSSVSFWQAETGVFITAVTHQI